MAKMKVLYPSPKKMTRREVSDAGYGVLPESRARVLAGYAEVDDYEGSVKTVFADFQGDFMTKERHARTYRMCVEGEITHQSMAVGDAVLDLDTDTLHLCRPHGWKILG